MDNPEENMMSAQDTIEKPPRSLSVRLYNRVGGWLRTLGLPMGSLTESSLIARARRRTGLVDFGDESFREPLGVLLRAYEQESELTPLGRLLVRASTVALLSNRLQVEAASREHPEILQSPLQRPLFIAGLPRTGTTLLYNLLAQDPGSRPLMMWEAISPVPRHGEAGREPDPRIARTALIVKILNRLAPRLMAVHPVNPTGPEECSRLQLNTFVTAYAIMENHVPSYREWFLAQPESRLMEAYRDYGRQLQVLQWQHPAPDHWVLKSPAHLFGLGPLMKVFPDARVLQIHRDPHKVIPSLCSLFAVYQGMASDHVRPKLLGPEVVSLAVEGLRRSQAAREAAPEGRILDLQYKKLVTHPIDTLRRVYDHFGYPWSDAFERQARQWMDGNPKNKHGKHRYDLAQFGLTPGMINEAFGPYCRQYGIEPEERPAFVKSAEKKSARAESGNMLVQGP